MAKKKHVAAVGIGVLVLVCIFIFGFADIFATEYRSAAADEPERFIPLPVLDIADYNARMLALAHVSSTTESISTA